ncbi:MAG: hydrogenase maturation nickel metallochaperone HypA [Acidobacteriota bacterium]
MHELSVALSILEFAEEEAGRRGTAVEAIHIKIGALSGIVKKALLSAYDLARGNTPLCDCRLVIEEVPIMIHCLACNANRLIPSAQRLCCPDCDTPASEIIQGKELQVVGLELAA